HRVPDSCRPGSPAAPRPRPPSPSTRCRAAGRARSRWGVPVGVRTMPWSPSSPARRVDTAAPAFLEQIFIRPPSKCRGEPAMLGAENRGARPTGHDSCRSRSPRPVQRKEPLMNTKKTLAAGAAVLAVALSAAACGDSDTDTTAAPTTAESTATTGTTENAAAHNQADVTFAQMMIPHHTQAVEMSDTLLGK